MPFSDKFREPTTFPEFDSWKQQRTPAAKTALLKALHPTIDKAISAYVPDAGSASVRGQAKIMALNAIDTYDPKFGASLHTHVMSQLQGLRRYAGQQNQIVKIPERIALDQAALDRSRQELTTELGREPSLTELSDHSNLSLKRIKHIHKFQAPVPEGFFHGAERADGEGGVDLPAVKDLDDHSWLDLVYHDSNPADQKIIEWTLGLHGQQQLSNEEIAAKLKMSPGRVSQRKLAIQQILNQQDQLSPF